MQDSAADAALLPSPVIPQPPGKGKGMERQVFVGPNASGRPQPGEPRSQRVTRLGAFVDIIVLFLWDRDREREGGRPRGSGLGGRGGGRPLGGEGGETGGCCVSDHVLPPTTGHGIVPEAREELVATLLLTLLQHPQGSVQGWWRQKAGRDASWNGICGSFRCGRFTSILRVIRVWQCHHRLTREPPWTKWQRRHAGEGKEKG